MDNAPYKRLSKPNPLPAVMEPPAVPVESWAYHSMV